MNEHYYFFFNFFFKFFFLVYQMCKQSVSIVLFILSFSIFFFFCVGIYTIFLPIGCIKLKYYLSNDYQLKILSLDGYECTCIHIYVCMVLVLALVEFLLICYRNCIIHKKFINLETIFWLTLIRQFNRFLQSQNISYI